MNAVVGIAVVLVAGGALLLIAGQAGLLRGSPPADLGVRDGRLKRPSFTENSVSSQADLHAGHPMRDYARIAPLPAPDGAAPALARVREALRQTPGVTVVEEREDYLRAQCETRLLRFVDDVEFWYDPAARQLQVRSASRIGRKDFGVNRARIEALRQRLAAAS